ncbi:MAG TPA: DEAD/DEAH box helicase [Myxococcales bacterium]|nr:DEAD/DEAH box helicase [Myxococcales bacterium]
MLSGLGFHPLVASWFEGRFGTPTEPQALGWPHIKAGEDTLIAAPTGSGKTLAAFLACLDSMIREGAGLRDETQVLYVSPLKALANDVQKNLLEPLAELRALPGVCEIRALVRTGDTPQAERQAMLRTPPHVLVTTPESFFLLLTSGSGRRLLKTVRTAVVDEIHAVARDKRGAHLALSLERLDALCGRRAVRIGLSATQRPIEEIGRFLTGGRGCAVVESGTRRPLDVGIEVPRDELSMVASKEQRAETSARVAELVREHRSTLVFVNTRRQVERVSHELAKILGEDQVVAHHGSLARPVRLAAEEKLKSGQVRCAVATASLELGIDVGAVDLVVQLESPRSLSVALQRIGRASHHRGGVPRGRLFPATRDQLVECAALVRGMRRGALEITRIPAWPRDVLAQQLVAMAACEDWTEDALFDLVRRAWPYRELPRAEFDALLEMHAEGVARRAGRAQGARLHRDGVNRVVKARRGSRLAAITSGGAIPETAQYAVVAEPEGVNIGQVDEDWAVESMAGDIFLLGNESWRIRRVEAGRVRVENAHGAPPSVPFWNGEAPGRTPELSAEVSALREELQPMLDDLERACAWLESECAVDRGGAEQIVRYLRAGRDALGALPSQRTLIAERFFDEAGGMQLVVHAPFGARLNRAFGLALRKRFCRTFDFELQAAATDEGILLSLGPQNSFPLETIFDFLSPASIDELLTQAALLAPMWGVRWRWNATRSLAVLRNRGGKKVPFNILRMRTDDLLAQVFPAQAQCQENAEGPIEPPDHPLVKETLRDCLTEAMDIEGLRALLTRMHDGEIRMLARDTPEPSPLSHEVLNSAPYAFLDDAPLEERRSRAVQLRRTLDPSDAAALGFLDAEAIREVVQQAWPDVRNADELHDVLLTLGFLREPPREWLQWLHELGARVTCRDGVWRAAERASAELLEAARGWMGILGPVTARELAQKLGVQNIDSELATLESEGLVLQGRFRQGATEVEWCERTLLARIHRLTLGRLRREIEPASTQDFLRFLLRWQHVGPGAQLHGAQGLSEVLAQLQGFQAAAAAWESELLPARVARYDKALLDQLCYSGEIAWGRLACASDDTEPRRRAPPGRATPVALVKRDDLEWLLQATRGAPEPLGERARLLLALLEQRGALFPHEIKSVTGIEKRELHDALWELVSGGRVTCDGFAALRTLLDARGTGASGRWSLLRPAFSAEAPQAEWLEKLSRQYMRRYGIVFRDLLARETRCPAWRDLLQVYRRLEARGEIRGGRFAQAFSGEQFALPEAVEALRAIRKLPKEGERVVLSACDPLNLAGILTPGARIPALQQNQVAYVDGVPEAPAALAG